MKDPLVHVLVINWNGIAHLEECFESLLASDYANARYVLVDNASTDGSVEFVGDRFGGDSRVEILELSNNLGWSGGNNAGMERAIAAGAEYVFLLNNDTAIATDAIGLLVESAEKDPAVGALAPKILLYDYPALVNSLGLEATDVGTAWDRGIGRLDGPKWDAVKRVAGVCGAAFFIRVDALKKTGLLPTDFEIYLDDLDLSLRVWNAGYEVLTCPTACVRHKFSATMGEGKRARRKYYLNTRNRMRLIERNYPLSKFPRLFFRFDLSEARAVGRALLDGELWRVWAHMRTWLDAFTYIPAAVAERKARAEKGLGTCRFWDLIRKDVQFSPGLRLPDDGWYPTIEIGGRKVRPMSASAHIDHHAETLEITQANPYPNINSLFVRVQHGDETLATLTGKEPHVTRIVSPPGRVTFYAETIFDAEQTGSSYDIGAWLGVRSL